MISTNAASAHDKEAMNVMVLVRGVWGAESSMHARMSYVLSPSLAV